MDDVNDTSGAHDGRWEYTDLVIPLNWQFRGAGELCRLPEYLRRYDWTVREHLRQAAQSGWQPDCPTNWGWLWSTGRVQFHSRREGFWPAFFGGVLVETYESVTIRLKRPAT